AIKAKVQPLTVWVQTDLTTAFARASNRDRRRADEKFSRSIDRATFDALATKLQPPQFREEYVVISGKYAFKSQAAAFTKRLRALQLLQTTSAVNVTVDKTTAPNNEATSTEAPSIQRPKPIIRPLSSPRRDQANRRIRIR